MQVPYYLVLYMQVRHIVLCMQVRRRGTAAAAWTSGGVLGTTSCADLDLTCPRDQTDDKIKYILQLSSCFIHGFFTPLREARSLSAHPLRPRWRESHARLPAARQVNTALSTHTSLLPYTHMP